MTGTYSIKLNSGRNLDLSSNSVDMCDYDNNVFQIYAVVWVTDAGECVNEVDFPTAEDRDEFIEDHCLDVENCYDLYDVESFDLVCNLTGEYFNCLCDVDVKAVAAR